MRLVKRVAQYLGFLAGLVAVFFALGWLLMRPARHSQSGHSGRRQPIQLVAVGDSLTQGVGDPQTAGGLCHSLPTPLRTARRFG